MTKKTKKSADEWRELLDDEQYHIAREGGTEQAFSGKYYDHKDNGLYVCVCCSSPLFSSEQKYDSGSGWPSFWQEIGPDAIETREDRSHGMRRTEILCARCDAHLGHVFRDGPEPTGLRFCVNSASLNFEPEADTQDPAARRRT